MTDPRSRLTAAIADRYAIERELGQGGMATVYLADDRKHRRRVAIKVLRPDLAEALGAERFVREIETTANLRHPHIQAERHLGRGGATEATLPDRVHLQRAAASSGIRRRGVRPRNRAS